MVVFACKNNNLQGEGMFHVKNHKQGNIFDPWNYLGPKRRDSLDNSWSGLFRKEILPELPVDILRSHYHDWNGRPTKELHSMIGLMILQQMHDFTDEEAVDQFRFNVKWHYALDITDQSDNASYVSNKTLWTMRDKLSTEKAYNDIFDITLKRLAEIFKVDFSSVSNVLILSISNPICAILAESVFLLRRSKTFS